MTLQEQPVDRNLHTLKMRGGKCSGSFPGVDLHLYFLVEGGFGFLEGRNSARFLLRAATTASCASSFATAELYGAKAYTAELAAAIC